MKDNKKHIKNETQKSKKQPAKNLAEKWKHMEKGKKDKIWFGMALVLILVVSILTANVNLTNELSSFVAKVWNNAQEAVEESAAVETLSEGAHVEIRNTQTAHLIEIYEVLGKDMDEDQAVSILQEVKTLAYHGSKRGVAASGKEIDSCINELKQKLKNADKSEYKRLVKRYSDEDNYWATLKEEIKEYVISEKVKEDKREELAKKKDTDIEEELQKYIDEIVGYEEFH